MKVVAVTDLTSIKANACEFLCEAWPPNWQNVLLFSKLHEQVQSTVSQDCLMENGKSRNKKKRQL